jgi:hypothetical protein
VAAEMRTEKVFIVVVDVVAAAVVGVAVGCCSCRKATILKYQFIKWKKSAIYLS